MSSTDLTLTTIIHHSAGRPDEWYDLRLASELSGMHPGMVREFARARVVDSFRSPSGGGPFFDQNGIHRLRQIERLRLRQRVNLRTICMVMRLLDRLDHAEHELDWFREQLR